MKQNVLRSQDGFTLIEIIAVLVVLGILAAVAVPKYVDLQGEAKKKAAMAQVAEIKSALNLGWAKALLEENGVEPTIPEVRAAAGLSGTGELSIGTAPDIWAFSLSVADDVVTINIVNRNGDIGYSTDSGTEDNKWTPPSM